MKKLLEVIPFILLLSLVVQQQLTSGLDPISFGFSVLALSALCGYRYYCMNNETPNYIKEFEKMFKDLESKNLEAMTFLEKEIKANKELINKTDLHSIKKPKANQFVF